ncbi:MAG: glycosyltransferase family 2 protein [bacterium]|nr:glycosyltransferase family 2 protein [bacterium]
MERVGIVICNYNKADMVCECIQTVLESNYTDYRIYVVDNASQDDSVERIRARFGEKVTLLVNERNLGGSGGFNTGIRKALAAGHEYVWCLDNDVQADEDALGVLVEFLDTHPDCGMAGSRVDHMEAPEYVQQYGITVDFEEFCVEAKYLNHLEDGTLPDVVYSDAVAACSVLVRSSLIREIGMLPEDNFLYWDDTEWGWRCNLAGHRVASCGKSLVLHAMGAKKESVSTVPTYYAWRNWIDFFARYTPEEKLENMYVALLNALFDVQYEGIYNGTENRANTAMAAFDDAMHGVRGEAKEGCIYDGEEPKRDRLTETVDAEKKKRGEIKRIVIEENGFAAQAERLKEQLRELCPQAEFVAQPDGESPCFSMCQFIFTQEDLSLQKYYVDCNGNVLAAEEDAMMAVNYWMSRRAFRYSMLPLFRRGTEQLRKTAAERWPESKSQQ